MPQVTERNLMQWRDFQNLFPIPIRPIRTEAEYNHMVSVMNDLMDTSEGNPRSLADQLLDLVALLNQQCEEQQPYCIALVRGGTGM